MKRFTVESANRALPLVRRIVEDIVRGYAEWQEKVRALEVLAGDVRIDMVSEDRTKLEKDAAGLAADVQSFLDRSDAYTFFDRLDDTIATGPTGTNVRDLRVMLAG